MDDLAGKRVGCEMSEFDLDHPLQRFLLAFVLVLVCALVAGLL